MKLLHIIKYCFQLFNSYNFYKSKTKFYNLNLFNEILVMSYFKILKLNKKIK